MLSPTLLLPLALLGHLEPLGARAPFVAGPGGGIAGGSTSWGLVVVDDDGGARRVCEESTGAPASLHLPVGAGGRILAIAGGQLLTTSDDGCSWQGVFVPAGAEVRDVDVGRDGVVWAAVGSAGHPSGLLHSDDGGQTFQPTPFWSGPSPLFDVAAGVDGAGPVVWASGHDIDLEGPFAVVARGDDVAVFGGDLSRYSSVRVVGVDAVGHGLAVGVLTSGASEILALGPATDGPVVVLGDVPLPATHIVALGNAVDDATDLYAIVTPGQLWHREDGAFVAAFVAVDGVRARCAVAAADGSLWLCGHTTGVLAGVHFARTSDGGQTFEIALRDDEITERRCPTNTVGGAVCARYLEEPNPGDPVDGTDPGTPDTPPTTPAPPAGTADGNADDTLSTTSEPVGCAGSATPLAVVVVGLRRRRRPRGQRLRP